MIYMDNASTTKIDPEVVENMMPYLTDVYGNPSSVHGLGHISHMVLDWSRKKCAEVINAIPDEIYFTSGGSESNNWALIGAYEALKKKGHHIITSKIEHPSILNTLKYLEEERGAYVTYLDVDAYGFIDIGDLTNHITKDTILISIMAANNEIGTIQPLAEIGAIAKRSKVYFHTDAVQAYGQTHIDVKAMNIDMLSMSGHKIHGPKGVGFLYMRKGLKIPPFIHGGHQERGKRAGTENVASIAGLGYAADTILTSMMYGNEEIVHMRIIRDHMIDRIKKEIPHNRLNGPSTYRLPNNINFSFRDVDGEALVMALDAEHDICASAGSACNSRSHDASHVLSAIHMPKEYEGGSLRLTISKYTTMEEADYVVDKVKQEVARIRGFKK